MLTRFDRVLIAAALDAASAMATLCFNGKQSADIPDKYRQYMDKAGSDYDVARRAFPAALREKIWPETKLGKRAR